MPGRQQRQLREFRRGPANIKDWAVFYLFCPNLEPVKNQAPQGQLLLRNVLGGLCQQEVLLLSDDELVELVRDEHRDLLRLTAEPVFVDVVRYPSSLPQYQIGHLGILTELEAALDKFPGLLVTGNALRGIGLADCLAQNFSRAKERYSA